MADPKVCGHSWRRIPTWYGRYQCEWCKALGYRVIVTGKVTPQQRTGHHIKVYKCQRTGCLDPAQTTYVGYGTRGRYRVCFAHSRARSQR